MKHIIINTLNQLTERMPKTTFKTSAINTSVTDFIHEQVKFLKGCGRIGTAQNYSTAVSTLESYLDGTTLSFNDVTARFTEKYADHLIGKGLKRNSMSFHMRILRAVYNKGVRLGLTDQKFPFKEVYTGIDKTRKRAIPEEIIRKLIRIDLKDNIALRFARDLFMFSFYTRGMAFVDMAYLRKTDLQNGMIHYLRRKTGQPLSVKIEPCINEIIERYSSPGHASPYIFPILEGTDPEKCYIKYKRSLRSYNYRLKQLSAMIAVSPGLSSYTSRHSWATAAHCHNVPVAVISAAMGHTSEETTRIYLSSVDNSLIDKANKSILELLKNPLSC